MALPPNPLHYMFLFLTALTLSVSAFWAATAAPPQGTPITTDVICKSPEAFYAARDHYLDGDPAAARDALREQVAAEECLYLPTPITVIYQESVSAVPFPDDPTTEFDIGEVLARLGGEVATVYIAGVVKGVSNNNNNNIPNNNPDDNSSTNI